MSKNRFGKSKNRFDMPKMDTTAINSTIWHIFHITYRHKGYYISAHLGKSYQPCTKRHCSAKSIPQYTTSAR